MINLSEGNLIDQFHEAIGRRFGLLLDDNRRPLLGELLARRAGSVGSPEAVSYVRLLLEGELPRDEELNLVSALTVGETYFFRHPDQLRAFIDAASTIPCASSGSHRRLHVLSAGCASGEEAYSLAILLRENVPESLKWDVRIVGIDVNAGSLAKAARARYTTWSLRGVSDPIRQKYFRKVDQEYVLDATIRAMVSFEERNLCDAADLWHAGEFDAIFCRNVLMYFTPEAFRTVIDYFTRALAPLGFLFLGPAETLRGVSNDYNLRHRHDAFYYQLRPQNEWAVARPPPTKEWSSPVAGDASWVSAIGLASERIAQLSVEASAQLRDRSDAPTPPRPGRPAGTPRPSLPTVREMIRQERYADALSVLNALTADERRDPDVKLLHAVSLTNSGAVSAAECLCHEILSGDELNAEARYLLALCLEHAGRHEAAAEQNETAVYLDSQFAMPHLHLGLLAKRKGDREGASLAFRRAVALLPREDSGRILLFGGGFSREMLLRLCEAELRACGGGA